VCVCVCVCLGVHVCATECALCLTFVNPQNFLRLSVDVYPTGSTEGHAALILDQGQGVLAVGEVETDATGAVVQW
jgi:hypothetical protein